MLIEHKELNYENTKNLYNILVKGKKDFYGFYHDHVYGLIKTEDFADLYSPDMGRPPVDPPLLAHALILAAYNNWTDRETAENICRRIDVKMALHLPLEYPGFNYSLLSIFRDRIRDSEKHKALLQKLLDKLVELGLLDPKLQRTDSTFIVSRGRKMKRYEVISEAVKLLIEVISSKIDKDDNLIPTIKKLYEETKKIKVGYKETEQQMDDKLKKIARIAIELLKNIDSRIDLTELEEYKLLNEIISQQVKETAEDEPEQQGGGPASHNNTNINTSKEEVKTPEKWDMSKDIKSDSDKKDEPEQAKVIEEPILKKTKELEDAIANPHDPEMRYGRKGSHQWFGAKVQVSESIPPDVPNEEKVPSFITNINVLPANKADQEAYEKTLETRSGKFNPKQEIADAGEISGRNIFLAEQKGIELLGVVPNKKSEFFNIEDFEFDEDKKVAICPAGKISKKCSQYFDKRAKVIMYEYRFKEQDCSLCPLKQKCTSAKARAIKFNQYYPYIHKLRKKSEDPEWAKKIKTMRAGIESTISMLVSQGFRRSRVFGLKKLEIILTFRAIAVNIKKLHTYLRKSKKMDAENANIIRTRKR